MKRFLTPTNVTALTIISLVVFPPAGLVIGIVGGTCLYARDKPHSQFGHVVLLWLFWWLILPYLLGKAVWKRFHKPEAKQIAAKVIQPQLPRPQPPKQPTIEELWAKAQEEYRVAVEAAHAFDDPDEKGDRIDVAERKRRAAYIRLFG